MCEVKPFFKLFQFYFMNQSFAFFCSIALASGLSSLDLMSHEVMPLNDKWRFHYGFQAPTYEITDVTLPHTWNRKDAMFGDKDYYRGLCNYTRMLPEDLKKQGKRLFLKVNAAQTVADIFIDNHFVAQHKGGYTAFVMEITD